MRTRGLLVTGLAVVVLAGCTSGDPDPAPTSSTPEPSADGDTWTAEELARATLDVPVEEADVLATVDGALYQVVGPDKPARILVTGASADDHGTTVTFVLRSGGGEEVYFEPYAFSRLNTGARDVRDISIIDPVAGIRMQPFLGTSGESRTDVLCTCAKQPPTMSDVGGELSATFPPLDPATTDIILEVPGFPSLEGIPVARG